MTRKNLRLSIKCFLVGMTFFSACPFVVLSQNNPYKQIRIPLDNQKGVPFHNGEEGYVIRGFDIDSNENFYFAGGIKAILACFSKDGKPVYRKSFSNLYPGPMNIVGKELYLFESWNYKINALIDIDKANGSIVREYPNTISKALELRHYNAIVDYRFSDSILSIFYTDGGGGDKPKTVCFNLKGELLPNGYQCPSNHFALEKDLGYEYLGKFGNDFVLGKFNGEGESATYDLSLRSSTNVVISNAAVQLKYVGSPLCGFYCLPMEHRKIRNNKLYMLNSETNMAVITEIDLAEIFHGK